MAACAGFTILAFSRHATVLKVTAIGIKHYLYLRTLHKQELFSDTLVTVNSSILHQVNMQFYFPNYL
jgi:hypothetical protein